MITKQELIEVLDIYVAPLYQIAGGIAALAVLSAAWFVVIRPFVKQVGRQ